MPRELRPALLPRREAERRRCALPYRTASCALGRVMRDFGARQGGRRGLGRVAFKAHLGAAALWCIGSASKMARNAVRASKDVVS
jgi:hypothetical protein